MRDFPRYIATGLAVIHLASPLTLLAAENGDEQAEALLRTARKNAELAYKVTVQRCRELPESGEQGQCIERAKATRDQALLHARFRARTLPRQPDERERNHRAALDRCEFMRGQAKLTCVDEANKEYGKN